MSLLETLPAFQKLPSEIVKTIEQMAQPRSRKERASIMYKECREIETRLKNMEKIATTKLPFGKYKGHCIGSLYYGKSNFYIDSSYAQWLIESNVLDKYFFNSDEIKEYMRLRFKVYRTESLADYIYRGNDD